jgi:hypothetical protein
MVHIQPELQFAISDPDSSQTTQSSTDIEQTLMARRSRVPAASTASEDSTKVTTIEIDELLVKRHAGRFQQ